MQAKGLTGVGTIKINKREIPKDFLPHKEREVGSSKFGFTKNVTIVSYVPKKNKSVILISSMHHDDKVDESTNKPDITLHYNSTKGGVDTVDQMCSVYSSSRRTNRWPMPVQYRILDMSALNAFIIQQTHQNARNLTRLNFLKGLSMSLCEPYMKIRCYNQRLPTQLRMSIATVLKLPPSSSETENTMKLDRNNRKRCNTCPPAKRAKTVHLCAKCQRPICMTCAKTVCNSCL